jgi:hypothetical protein
MELSQFEDDMILYLKVQRDLTRKLLGLINIFSKVTRHKISINIHSCFYIPIMKRLRKKSKKQSLSQLPKKVKYLGIK